MKKKLIFLIPFLAVLFSVLACSGGGEPVLYKDVGTAINSMQEIYIRVYNGSLDAWSGANTLAPFWWAVFWFLFFGTVVTIVVSRVSGNIRSGFAVGGITAAVIALTVSIIVSGNLQRSWPTKAEKQAVFEMNNGVSSAKDNKANQYLEYLNVPVVKVDRVWQECEQRNNSRNTCGNYVPEWTYEHNPHDGACNSWDDEGDCDGHETVYDTARALCRGGG